ncbi:MAG TPA: class I SAM-dependent methyltransferase [bacterium]|nr:class I SAM-dependent methyltransferase [bacterium]
MIFQSVAEYYEILSDNASRLQREQKLLMRLLAEAPGTRVADVACGTGLHADFFASLGAEVNGFDISPEMVDVARGTRKTSNVTFQVGDMRTLSGGLWDLILCIGNSLSLLGSLDEIRETFVHVHSCLSPGGLFAIQILNTQSEQASKPRHRVEHKALDDGSIVAVKNLIPHEGGTLLSLTFFHLQGDRMSSVSETARLLHLTLEQISQIAEQSGLKVTNVYGGLDGSPYDPSTSGDLVVVMRGDS